MPKKQVVVIIHGIGQHKMGYSREFQKELELKNVEYVEICYSHLLDNGIIAYNQNEQNNKKLGYDKLREIFNLSLYDAISYGYVKRQILSYINSLVPKYENAEITVIAHSLGGIVAYDWLHHYKRTIKNFFTLGSPLALKMVTRKHQLDLSYWMNIVGADDIIGKIIKVYPSDMLQVGRDYIAPIGTVLQRKTPFSHTAYWTDGNVVKPIRKKLEMDSSGSFNEKKYNKYVDGLWKV